MDNYLGNPMNLSVDYMDRMEKMYPDCYTRIYPHVQDIVDSLSDESMYNLSNENINQLTDEAVRRSNVMNDPPMGHNRSTINDFTRALMVRDMFDRHRRRRFNPFFFPFFFFPFDDRDRDRDRRRDHDRDRF
ncbi:hypothetical protein [Hydrogenoanaerobacterium sp.]|uniref:hypothetical protein n=1 Tax=Hydrogenoanaerobacterium sp. TaxID=2953763 RepID=UPI00289D8E98|nr:hypothetical protein [Hydrogenoanaerobacterium sp.]